MMYPPQSFNLLPSQHPQARAPPLLGAGSPVRTYRTGQRRTFGGC